MQSILIINIDKNQMQAGKIHLALSAWKQDYGCTVDDQKKDKFDLLNEDDDVQWYKTSIDVSSPKTATDEVEVSFPLLYN